MSFEARRPLDSDAFESDGEQVEDQFLEVAGDMLVQFLFAMHYKGQLSPKSMAVVCSWAFKARALGPVSQFGFRPEARTGHYQRHLDACIGMNMKNFSLRY